MIRKPKRKVKKSNSSISISHDYARQQEIDAANEYGGYTTSKSGAGNIKGDVRIKGKYRIECKCTKNKSYSLNYEYLEKFIEQAISLGEDPILQVHFIDELGIKKRGFIVIPEEFIKDKLLDR
jgi:hypothetical protein